MALLTFLKSVQDLKDLSSFGTKIHGEDQGLFDFSMILFSNMYFTLDPKCLVSWDSLYEAVALWGYHLTIQCHDNDGLKQ